MRNFKKRVSLFFIAAFLLYSAIASGQTYRLGDTQNQGGWYKIGRISLAQGGADAQIRITGGYGFNAAVDQLGTTYIHFRTSNGSASINGFLGTGYYYNSGYSKMVNALVMQQLSSNSWDVYANLPNYSGYYSMLIFESAQQGAWTPAFDKVASPPSSGTIYWFGEKFIMNSNAQVAGNLEIYGNIRANEIKVEVKNWPDYVFKPNYKIRSLAETEKFIQVNGHLPDMPKAEIVEKEGYSLNEMDKLLLRKVEELTVQLIEKDKVITEMMKRLKKLEQK